MDDQVDVQVSEHGGAWLLTPMTEVGRVWLKFFVKNGKPQDGGAVEVDSRVIFPTVEGMELAALKIGASNSFARVRYALAKFESDRAFRHYNELNARAYDLKIKIRPEHWPEEMKG